MGDLPPILTADEAASLLRISKSTLYTRVSQGLYTGCVRRNRPLLFWRDRLIQREFQNPRGKRGKPSLSRPIARGNVSALVDSGSTKGGSL